MFLAKIKDILSHDIKSFFIFQNSNTSGIGAHRIVKIHVPILIFSGDFDVGAATILNSLFEKKKQMEGAGLLKYFHSSYSLICGITDLIS